MSDLRPTLFQTLWELAERIDEQPADMPEEWLEKCAGWASDLRRIAAGTEGVVLAKPNIHISRHGTFKAVLLIHVEGEGRTAEDVLPQVQEKLDQQAPVHINRFAEEDEHAE